jgi:hypothetical protein
VSTDSASGQRYIDPTGGWSFFLFVRPASGTPFA